MVGPHSNPGRASKSSFIHLHHLRDKPKIIKFVTHFALKIRFNCPRPSGKNPQGPLARLCAIFEAAAQT